MRKARIFFIDIETSPILVWVWNLFKPIVAIDQIKEDWKLLCWSGKWLDEPVVLKDALWFHENEKEMLEDLWEILNYADIIVAHNAEKFDVAKINAKFFEHGIKPPSPYKVVDTLKVAKTYFNLSSNKLNYITKLIERGEKLKTDFELWLKVMEGDEQARQYMLDYNGVDIILLQDVYLAMLPWIKNHPNLGLYNKNKDDPHCSKCNSTNMKKDGTVKLTAGIYQQYRCKECGGWARGSENLMSREERQVLLRNIL